MFLQAIRLFSKETLSAITLPRLEQSKPFQVANQHTLSNDIFYQLKEHCESLQSSNLHLFKAIQVLCYFLLSLSLHPFMSPPPFILKGRFDTVE